MEQPVKKLLHTQREAKKHGVGEGREGRVREGKKHHILTVSLKLGTPTVGTTVIYEMMSPSFIK